jgi:hypothetical protein
MFWRELSGDELRLNLGRDLVAAGLSDGVETAPTRAQSRPAAAKTSLRRQAERLCWRDFNHRALTALAEQVLDS